MDGGIGYRFIRRHAMGCSTKGTGMIRKGGKGRGGGLAELGFRYNA